VVAEAVLPHPVVLALDQVELAEVELEVLQLELLVVQTLVVAEVELLHGLLQRMQVVLVVQEW
tara:strand:+ start:256 stop:444 length:189 start_codon:yes stop_codon:yes gene_type:complete